MVCRGSVYGIGSHAYNVKNASDFACGSPDVQTRHLFVYAYIDWINATQQNSGGPSRDSVVVVGVIAILNVFFFYFSIKKNRLRAQRQSVLTRRARVCVSPPPQPARRNRDDFRGESCPDFYFRPSVFSTALLRRKVDIFKIQKVTDKPPAGETRIVRYVLFFFFLLA